MVSSGIWLRMLGWEEGDGGMVMKTKVEGCNVVVSVERRRGSDFSPAFGTGVVISSLKN